jgi:hypothetical protein
VTDDGLWIVDQITDRAALVEISEPNSYGTTKILAEIPTESSNTSGMCYDGSSLWLAANGPGDRWRPRRPTDASTGEILKVDPATGDTIMRRALPGGGGTHGLDIDKYQEGLIWLGTLRQKTMSLVRIADWEVIGTIPLTYERGHGVVRVEDGLWVAHTTDRVILKLDTSDGRELDRIDIPGYEPEPHGVSIYGDDLIYCDASSGWVVQITL